MGSQTRAPYRIPTATSAVQALTLQGYLISTSAANRRPVAVTGTNLKPRKADP